MDFARPRPCRVKLGHMTAKRIAVTIFLSLLAAFGGAQSLAALPFESPTQDAAQTSAQPAVARAIGAIKAVTGTTLTLAPDSGPEISVTVLPTAKLLHIAPGEKDLSKATAVQMQDLQVGD